MNKRVCCEKSGVREECGIFGVIQQEKAPLAREVYYGLFALQHRGQESAGIAVNMPNRRIAYYKNMGLVNEVFSDEELSMLPDSDIAIGHVRYSTCGSSNVVNAQPVVFYGRFGRMAIAHNGNIVNAASIKQKLIEQGHIFQSSVDSEVVAALINSYITTDIESGIQRAALDFVGAFAIVCMADNKLIAIRDKHGLKPLVMGTKEGSVIFASESCALDALEAEFVRDIEPGEMVTVDLDGAIQSSKYATAEQKSCIFEYVYLARSDSIIDGCSVYESRYNCGRELARLFKIDADIVAGVPDSATVCARGYADVSGLPMVDALTKNRYIGRTFIQPSQSLRENSVKIKLNAFRSNIKGKRLILIDDSIVRGTTSKKIINILRANGAKEVHMLVKYPCHYGVDMETRDHLIGAYKTEEEICKEIGADSLHYIPLYLLKESCGGGSFCAACFDGNYPMEISEGEIISIGNALE